MRFSWLANDLCFYTPTKLGMMVHHRDPECDAKMLGSYLQGQVQSVRSNPQNWTVSLISPDFFFSFCNQVFLIISFLWCFRFLLQVEKKWFHIHGWVGIKNQISILSLAQKNDAKCETIIIWSNTSHMHRVVTFLSTNDLPQCKIVNYVLCQIF